MTIIQTFVLFAALSLVITGCSELDKTHAQTSDTVNQQAVTFKTDQWLGTWYGVEGTLLQIAGGEGKYKLTIETLDGPRVLQGIASGDQIQFERDGVKESIHASNGEETGMKWLSDKTNCLTVVIGEGYCRD